MRHSSRRTTKGKVPIKHGSSLIDNTGSGVGSLFVHTVAVTDVGPRLGSGAPQDLDVKQRTDEICMVGGQIKYFNLCVECSPRGTEPTNLLDNSGWLEWGLIWQDQETQDLNTTNIGIESLGVLLNRMYRQDCIYTGCMPIGARQSMAMDMHIKVPQRMQRMRMGSLFKLFCYFRSSSSTDTRTDSHRILASSMFKTYN